MFSIFGFDNTVNGILEGLREPGWRIGNPEKMTKNEFDIDFTDEPVCPYCGKVQWDAWEIDLGPGLDGEGQISCGSCDKEFLIRRHCSVTYSTMKLTENVVPK